MRNTVGPAGSLGARCLDWLVGLLKPLRIRSSVTYNAKHPHSSQKGRQAWGTVFLGQKEPECLLSVPLSMVREGRCAGSFL